MLGNTQISPKRLFQDFSFTVQKEVIRGAGDYKRQFA